VAIQKPVPTSPRKLKLDAELNDFLDSPTTQSWTPAARPAERGLAASSPRPRGVHVRIVRSRIVYRPGSAEEHGKNADV
jgi:hypothetical protein